MLQTLITGTVGPVPIYKNWLVVIQSTVDLMCFRISIKICFNSVGYTGMYIRKSTWPVNNWHVPWELMMRWICSYVTLGSIEEWVGDIIHLNMASINSINWLWMFYFCWKFCDYCYFVLFGCTRLVDHSLPNIVKALQYSEYFAVSSKINKVCLVCVSITEILLASFGSHGNRICAVCHIVCHCCLLPTVSWLARDTDHHAHRTGASWLGTISADKWTHSKRFCHHPWLCHNRLLLIWAQAVTLTCHRVTDLFINWFNDLLINWHFLFD